MVGVNQMLLISLKTLHLLSSVGMPKFWTCSKEPKVCLEYVAKRKVGKAEWYWVILRLLVVEPLPGTFIHFIPLTWLSFCKISVAPQKRVSGCPVFKKHSRKDLKVLPSLWTAKNADDPLARCGCLQQMGSGGGNKASTFQSGCPLNPKGWWIDTL